MPEILFAIFAAALIYLVPGFIIIQWVDLQEIPLLKKIFYGLCLSLIVVPYSFIAISNIIPFVPGPASLGILILFLLCIALLLKRFKQKPILTFMGEAQKLPVKKLEEASIWLWIAIFAAIGNLPRLGMFLQGGQTFFVAPADETWHLTQLISVARTGIPPTHYFFPSLRLSSYYGSWIYPAILGNFPFFTVSLARAMAIHAYVQIFAFLGLVYCFLRCNYKKGWVRWLGISFFTIVGGLDLYANFPDINNLEMWQGKFNWISNPFQISLFTTLYEWVPHHLAGGMAFLLAMLVWKNLKASILVKSFILGLALAFCFSTSAFVFLSFGLAVGLYLLFQITNLLKDPKKIGALAVIIVVFLPLALSFLTTYLGRDSGFAWNDMRVQFVENYRGDSPTNMLLDKVLLMAGFPIIAGWILMVEIGLPFLIYLFWVFRKLFSRRESFTDPIEWVCVVLPPLFLFVAFLVQDVGGGGNLIQRGFIPAQILINFGGLYGLDRASNLSRLPIWKKGVLLYFFVCFIAAQGMTTLAEVNSTSYNLVYVVYKMQFKDLEVPEVWPDSLEHVHWLNENSPSNALILENGCPSGRAGDYLGYRWLERVRFLTPGCVKSLSFFQRDMDYVLPGEWQQFNKLGLDSVNILDAFQATQLYWNDKLPLFLIDWDKDQPWAGDGISVFEDNSVIIYRLR